MSRRRRHNCQAESNVRLIRTEWSEDGETIVSTWGCRRCPETWETVYDPKQAEAERLAQLHEMVRSAADRMAVEAE